MDSNKKFAHKALGLAWHDNDTMRSLYRSVIIFHQPVCLSHTHATYFNQIILDVTDRNPHTHTVWPCACLNTANECQHIKSGKNQSWIVFNVSELLTGFKMKFTQPFFCVYECFCGSSVVESENTKNGWRILNQHMDEFAESERERVAEDGWHICLISK